MEKLTLSSFKSGLISRAPSDMIPEDAFSDCDNVELTEKFVPTKVKGFQKYNTTALGSAIIRGMGIYQLSSGTKYYIAACGGKLYYSVAGTGTWTAYQIDDPLEDVTFDAATDVEMVQYNNCMYVVTGKYPVITNEDFSTGRILKISGTTCSVLTDSNVPQSLIAIIKHQDRLFGITSGSQLFWSEPYDPEDWLPVEGLNYDYVGKDDGDTPRGLVSFAGYVYVMKETHVYRYSTMGEITSWGATMLDTSYGAIAHRTICEVNGAMYWLSKDGVVKCNGADAVLISENIRDKVIGLPQMTNSSRQWLLDTASDLGGGTFGAKVVDVSGDAVRHFTPTTAELWDDGPLSDGVVTSADGATLKVFDTDAEWEDASRVTLSDTEAVSDKLQLVSESYSYLHTESRSAVVAHCTIPYQYDFEAFSFASATSLKNIVSANTGWTGLWYGTNTDPVGTVDNNPYPHLVFSQTGFSEGFSFDGSTGHNYKYFVRLNGFSGTLSALGWDSRYSTTVTPGGTVTYTTNYTATRYLASGTAVVQYDFGVITPDWEIPITALTTKPTGTDVVVETSTSANGSDWSEYVAPTVTEGVSYVASTKQRYLRVRLTLTTALKTDGTTSVTPTVNSLCVGAAYVSPSLDYGFTPDALGHFSIVETKPTGTGITYQTRSSADNNTWEAWAAVTNGGEITSTVACYVQWKAILVPSSTANSVPSIGAGYIRAEYITESKDTTVVSPTFGKFEPSLDASGQTVKFYMRTSADNATWSAWVEQFSNTFITGITNARYFQIKVVLDTDDSSELPYVDYIKVIYYTGTIIVGPCAASWKGEYWLNVAGDGQTANDIVYRYNTENGYWLKRSNIHNNAWLVDNDKLIGGSSAADGFVRYFDIGATDDGVAIDCWFETKEFALLEMKKLWRRIYLIYRSNADFALGYSLDGAAYINLTIPDSGGELTMYRTQVIGACQSYHIKFKVRQAVEDALFEFHNLSAEWQGWRVL